MVFDMGYTTDSIVSFRPIGRTLRDIKIDYTEPRLTSARHTQNPLSLNSFNILIPAQPPTKYTSLSTLVMPQLKQTMPTPSETPQKVDSGIAKMHLTNMPDIRPCNTASPPDTKQAFYPLKLHRIFFCSRFHNPKHIASAAAYNTTLVDTNKPPTPLGTFSTILKSNEG